MKKYHSILEIKQANQAIGHHWFSPDTLRFFSSRIHDALYGGCYFVSSERDSWTDGDRRYTVRQALSDGRVETVGAFQQYASRNGAHKAAQRLANAL